MSGYDDFGLGLHLGAAGQIWVSASSRLGHVHGVTSVKPGDDALVELSEHLYDLLDAIRFAERFDATAMTAALGEIVFGEPVVRELFQAARGAAADRGRQLIVRIQASPHLTALPWELLPDPSLTLGGGDVRYLTLSADVHVVRLSRGRTYPLSTAPVEPPLNLLVVLSSPMGQKAGDDALTFDIYEAKRSLLDELMPLEEAGWLNIDIEDRPTMDNLRRRVRSKRRGYHLLHYLGHAEPDLLLLEDERGRRQDVAGARLVDWLRSCPDLRLITFAGCETARPAGDPTAQVDSTDWQQLLSLAERAAQGSSPVVLGMQAVLPFRTEAVLTRSLYQALASGNTVVDALRLARAAVRSDDQVSRGVLAASSGMDGQGELLDWAIPALFMNSTEPAPLLERSGSPPRFDRRRSNMVKFEPPTGRAGIIGRDVPLRQAVEVLCGNTRERVLVMSGTGGSRASELLDRAVDEIDGRVSDILAVSYRALNDLEEARPFLSERELALAESTEAPTPELVISVNLCASIAQLLERHDGRPHDRRPEWPVRRWWAWLTEDLAGRQAVIAIDGVDALQRVSGPLRVLACAWLRESFPLDGRGPMGGVSLEHFVEFLRDPDRKDRSEAALRRAQEFDAFVHGEGADRGLDGTAQEILAGEAEELLNQRLAGPLAREGDPGPVDQKDVERARQDLAAVRSGIDAVGDMVSKLVRRSPVCRIALVVDEAPEHLLRDIDDLVFPMRLAESTWPEMWRWIRRSLPGLVRFGQGRLKGVWRKYLGSDVERWEELERRVRAGAVGRGIDADRDHIQGMESPETDLERLALVICARRVHRRPGPVVAPGAGRVHRRDRPLVVASAAALAGTEQDSDSRLLSFATFQARLNALAEQHGIGGRVTTTALNQLDTLARLVPVPSPFKDGGAPQSDINQWYRDVGAEQPDIVLLDFGQLGLSDADEVERRLAFPGHRTLQVAAGGNSHDEASTDEDDDPVSPAWDKEVLAVGALDEDGQIRGFSSRNRRDRKPDIFATDRFDPTSTARGTSFAAAYVVVAAILVWTLLPERTPRGLRRFLLESATPLGPDPTWPLRLDLDAVLAAARRERIMSMLARGRERASLQAVVAMTGLDWQWAETTLKELVDAGQVAETPVGRDVVYEHLDLDWKPSPGASWR